MPYDLTNLSNVTNYLQQMQGRMYTPNNGANGMPSQGWDGWSGYDPTKTYQTQPYSPQTVAAGGGGGGYDPMSAGAANGATYDPTTGSIGNGTGLQAAQFLPAGSAGQTNNIYGTGQFVDPSGNMMHSTGQDLGGGTAIQTGIQPSAAAVNPLTQSHGVYNPVDQNGQLTRNVTYGTGPAATNVGASGYSRNDILGMAANPSLAQGTPFERFLSGDGGAGGPVTFGLHGADTAMRAMNNGLSPADMASGRMADLRAAAHHLGDGYGGVQGIDYYRQQAQARTAANQQTRGLERMTNQLAHQNMPQGGGNRGMAPGATRAPTPGDGTLRGGPMSPLLANNTAPAMPQNGLVNTLNLLKNNQVNQSGPFRSY